MKTVNYDVVVENRRMPQVSISLESEFVAILTAPGFDSFTVLELRSAYMALTNRNLDKTQAQRIVYRQILKLKNKGLLKRIDSKTTKKTTYVKTDLFHSANFISNDTIAQSEKVSNVSASSQDVVKELVDRVQRYKAELQSLLGESNEYKSLYAEYPQLKGLQENYNHARDQIRNIHGMIKAVETSIENQQALEAHNETS